MHVRLDCAGQTHEVVAEVRRDLELKADTAGLQASEKVLRQQIGQLQVGLAACVPGSCRSWWTAMPGAAPAHAGQMCSLWVPCSALTKARAAGDCPFPPHRPGADGHTHRPCSRQSRCCCI